MTRQVAGVVVLAFCGVSVAGLQTQRPPTFRGGANFVLVDVYPTDNARIVEGLKAADFQVLENGRPQAIEQFEFIRIEPSPEAMRRDPSTQAEALDQAADPHNRLFVVYLDHYHVNADGSHATQRPLVEALNQVLAPNDLFGVITPRMRPRDIVFGRRTLSLETQLRENWIWGLRQSQEREPDEQALEGCFKFYDYTKYGQPRYVDDGVVKRWLRDVLIARSREDKVLTHLEDLVSYLGTVREARKAVLLFTNGWVLYPPDLATIEKVMTVEMDEDNNAGRPPVPVVGVTSAGRLTVGERQDQSGTPSCNGELQRLFRLDNRRRLNDIVAVANRHNVTFYPVNPSGLDVFDQTLADRPPVPPEPTAALMQDQDRLRFRTESMQTLAGATDGLAVITNDLGGGLRRIVDDVSAYYLLGYYSTDKRFDGGYRRIEVKIAKPGVRVRARRGYFAPKDAAPAAPAAAPTSVAALPAGVTEALGALAKLQSAPELFTYATIEGRDVSVAVEIAAAQAGTPRFAAGVDVEIAIARTSGETVVTAKGKIEPAARATQVRVPIPAAYGQGPWRAVVRIAGTPSLDDRADVRTSSSQVLGRPLIYRATPAGTSPLRPAADFQFRRTERAHVEWPIRGAVDERSARLLSRAGQPLPVPVTVTEREVDGRRVLAADVVLAPLGEGDYVIELAAGAAGAPERQYLAIRVTR